MQRQLPLRREVEEGFDPRFSLPFQPINDRPETVGGAVDNPPVMDDALRQVRITIVGALEHDFAVWPLLDPREQGPGAPANAKGAPHF